MIVLSLSLWEIISGKYIKCSLRIIALKQEIIKFLCSEQCEKRLQSVNVRQLKVIDTERLVSSVRIENIDLV